MKWYQKMKESQKRKKRLATKYGKQCVWCGCPLRINGEKVNHKLGIEHHVIPKSRGGTDAMVNVCLVCEPCHEEIHKIGY